MQRGDSEGAVEENARQEGDEEKHLLVCDHPRGGACL